MKLKKLFQQSKQRTNICKLCFKDIESNTLHSMLYKEVGLCHNCLVNMSPVLRQFDCDGVQAFHIYFYNTKIQEILYQFKGCFDYELKSIFLEYYRQYLNLKFRGYIIIPAASSEESDKERGFNHVEEMFSVLNLKMEKCIHKTSEIKQTDLTTSERNNISKYLEIDDIDLSGKKVLLVDDVYTTGSTIKAMIKLVRGKHPKKIKVLLMSKTIDLEKR